MLQTEPIYWIKVSKFGYFRNKSRYLKITENHIQVMKDPKTNKMSQEFFIDYQTIIEWSQSIICENSTTIKIQRFKLQRQFSLSMIDALKLYQTLKGLVIFTEFNIFYQLGDKLGEGISSSVYKAIQLSTKKQFAIKIINSSFYGSFVEGLEIIYNELRILKSLNHQRIIKIQDVFFQDGQFSLVFDFLQGETVQDKIDKNVDFTIEQVRKIMFQVLEALMYIHSKKIIHRDIKASNLMFNKDSYDQLTLVDFGLSVLSTESKFMFAKCGTPGYIAPEIIKLTNKYQKYSNKCDIFSAGVLFHRLYNLVVNIRLIGRKLIINPGLYNTKDVYRISNINFNANKYRSFPQEALTLLQQMLHSEPNLRVSAKEALINDFFLEEKKQLNLKQIRQQQFDQFSLELSQKIDTQSFTLLDDIERGYMEEQVLVKIRIPLINKLQKKSLLEKQLTPIKSPNVLRSSFSSISQLNSNHGLQVTAEKENCTNSQPLILHDDSYSSHFYSMQQLSQGGIKEKITFYQKDSLNGLYKIQNMNTRNLQGTLIKSPQSHFFITKKIKLKEEKNFSQKKLLLKKNY